MLRSAADSQYKHALSIVAVTERVFAERAVTRSTNAWSLLSLLQITHLVIRSQNNPIHVLCATVVNTGQPELRGDLVSSLSPKTRSV